MNALELALAQAIANPQDAELEALWDLLLETLAALPQAQQFEIAGDVVLTMADILVQRAQLLLDNQQPESAELTAQRITRDLITPFTRSMHCNLTPFTKPKPGRKPRKTTIAPTDSVVGEVDRTVLLAVLDQDALDQDAQESAIALSHEEAISEWGQQLQPHLQQTAIPLVELGDRANMPLVQVWMTALLDTQLQIHQTGSFYDQEGLVVQALSQG